MHHRDAIVLREPHAAVFDLDGVLVDSARLHSRAWKLTFDSYFTEHGLDDMFEEDDYRRHVDGRPRYEGVAAFLRSRGIQVPTGDPADEPGFTTQTAIGNLKNRTFNELLEAEGAEMLPGAAELLEALARENVPVAVVSSSRNAPKVLPDEMRRHIRVLLGGGDIDDLDLPGKPDPAMFLEGARQLGVSPARAAVVEDARAGVRAGVRGGFAVVVGIDPEGVSNLDLVGADVVVEGVGQLPKAISGWSDLIPDPPSALDAQEVIRTRLGDRPAIFLDYDGTLTPIVDDPAAANIGDPERTVLRRLAGRSPLAVISGRGLDDVKGHVGVDGITYSGSHGFEIERADGQRFHQEEVATVVPELGGAETALLAEVDGLPGVMIERKPYAIAVHTRRARDDETRAKAKELAERVGSKHPDLVVRAGKEIFELRPALDWDKGAALAHLLELIPGSPVPMYIGDDDTDEDAFAVVRRRSGIGILVGDARGAETWAGFTLDNPGETIEFLAKLGESLDG